MTTITTKATKTASTSFNTATRTLARRPTPNMAVGNTALAYARTWRSVDADGQILGRMATRIAITLMGKHKPIFDPATDCGDYVVVTNASKVAVTGKKADQKLYRHHTMYPGGLKEIPYKTMLKNKPEEVSATRSGGCSHMSFKTARAFLCQIIRRAVSGMLPKNRLRAKRLDRLMIFADAEHPYKENLLKDYSAQLGETWSRVKKAEAAAAAAAASPTPSA
ncbi:BQ5605_C004g02615 [Microbotryum silenes-dioicae]|uniref:BQ5605_C004g02615 protein n=1 Tax=Microbotryum silenes-dioicae TaxID=796604 RepID=A0A2X0PAP8_9BASI|nr:BQ5605_C004g02615 [Microbotryum silenes-dioicae]